MDNSETEPFYDHAQALALVCHRQDLRDFVLKESLNYFADDGDIAPLLDIGRYPEAMRELAELAHQATGVARHASMPRLALRLRALNNALDAGQCALAQELAEVLSELLDATRTHAIQTLTAR
jgi:hypothetical protein